MLLTFRHIFVKWCFENPKQKWKIGIITRQTHTHEHTLTGIHTAHRVLRSAKSVLALVHVAAGDQGAVVDCFLVRLVHLQLRQLPALQQRVVLAHVGELCLHGREANDERLWPLSQRSGVCLVQIQTDWLILWTTSQDISASGLCLLWVSQLYRSARLNGRSSPLIVCSVSILFG